MDSFKNIPEKDWLDWHWQIKNRVMDLETLVRYISLTDQEKKDIKTVLKQFRMAVTPYYLSRINPDDPCDPIRRQAIPTILETHRDASDLDDPLHEDIDSPAPGLTHRYPDRVLLLTTHICSMYCRHCTRRRKVGDNEDCHFTKEQLTRAFNYIREHKEVRDIVVSGGDPFTLSDQEIEWILSELRKIDHVEIIRFGTRTPVVMPMRITPELCSMLKRYHPVYINTHFNHYNEITPEAKRACEMLADHGMPLGNQSVLLRGVNDDPAVMKKLCYELLKIRVKPYYIYQCDMSVGISHFRTPLSAGIRIIENLRGHISGLGVPHFVIDAPGGGGKVPVMPTYIISQAPGKIVLRNYEGRIVTCADPPIDNLEQKEELSRYYSQEGVAELLNTGKPAIDPDRLAKKGPRRG
ncbi:MAG: lysine 2,3-aminomutase [Candidatus Wallbacteria bacterium]|nr:lysine 2,3-aminomutase [Candidatus Wallbacteria bacterium]